MEDYGQEQTAESSAPVAGKLKPKEHKTLRERFKCGTKYYEERFKPYFERCLEQYQGSHHQMTKSQARASGSNCVVVNYSRYAVQTALNSVAFNLPDVLPKPQNREGERNEDTTRRAVNYEYRISKAHRELQRAEFDYFLCDLGIVATGWEFKTDTVHLTDQRQAVEGEEPEPEAVLAAVESGKPLAPAVPQDKVRKDNCYAKRLDPRCWRIDPECDSQLDNAQWCGFVEYVTLDKLRRDPRYKNVKDLKGSSKSLQGYFSDEYRKTDADKLPSDVKRVELWHYYELERRLHCVYCEEHDKPLLEEEWHWEADRYPFRVNVLPGSESEFYPNPPRLLQWEHMQQEINKGRSQLADIREKCAPFFLAQNGALDQKSRKQLESGVINRVVELNAQNLQASFQAAPHSTLPIDFWQALEKAEGDFRTLSGLNQYEAGQTPSKRLTTAEVQAISGSAAALRRQDVQKFEEFCAGVAADFHAWLQQYAIRTRSLPIYDDGKVVDFKDYTKSDIRGEYEFEVFVGSTELETRAGKLEKISHAFQTITPFMQMMDPMTGQPLIPNPAELVTQFLKAMPEIRNVDAIMAPQPPQQPGMMPPGMDDEDGLDGMGGMPAEMLPPDPMTGGGGQQIPPELLAQLGAG
jgi:hypothetical protein